MRHHLLNEERISLGLGMDRRRNVCWGGSPGEAGDELTHLRGIEPVEGDALEASLPSQLSESAGQRV